MDFYLVVSSLILGTLLHYGIQKIFIYYKRFDSFNSRSSHKTLATRTGGIGIFICVFSISLFYYFNQIQLFDYSLLIPLGIMFIVGVYDDLYNADFKLKLLLELFVAKILIDQGFIISNYHGLFGIYEVPWILAQLTTIFAFLVVVNAINFIDGIDGLAITEVCKIIFLFEFFSSNVTSLFPLGVLTISSIIPLYYFNFKKKGKVFLGDGGSLLLGTLVMIYGIYFLSVKYTISADYSINKVLLIVLILLYPLVDLFRVFILRIIDGKSPFIADQKHLHHILLKRYSSIKATILIFCLSIFILFSFLKIKL